MQKVTVTIDTGTGKQERYEGIQYFEVAEGIRLTDWSCEGRPHQGMIFLPWSHVIKVEDE